MKGRSTPEQRTLAWSISVIVIAVLLLGFLVSPISLTDMITPSGNSPIDYFSVTLQVVGGVFLITTLQEMLFPHKKPYVSKLRKYSPMLCKRAGGPEDSTQVRRTSAGSPSISRARPGPPSD